jgi:hypothetical protein
MSRVMDWFIFRDKLLAKIVITAFFVFFVAVVVKSQHLKIVQDDFTFYVQFPDGSKVKIIKDQGCGSREIAVLSSDDKYVFYTQCTGIGVESSGKDMFFCKPDGSERTFLHKIEGDAEKVHWIKNKGHNYLLFLEVLGESGYAYIDFFDFDQRKMLLKIEGWVLEPTKQGDCFVIERDPSRSNERSTICFDSLLSMSNPNKYNVQVYEGWGYHNELYLSTRREPFLNPDYYWMKVRRYNDSEYGGIGISYPSHNKFRKLDRCA